MDALVTSDILSHASKLSQVSTIVSRTGINSKVGTFNSEKKRLSVVPSSSYTNELVEIRSP
jgi:hypothetical protein